MASQIDELVRMRDVETLYELMTEDDEWITQLDAAEAQLAAEGADQRREPASGIRRGIRRRARLTRRRPSRC